jgi:hypothetical protein
MAFGRVVELTVGEDGTGTLISDLDIEFKIEKTQTITSNYCEIKVFNASSETRTKILKKGANIILTLGYEDEQKAVVFIGNIETAYSSRNGSTWETVIKAYSVRSKTQKLEALIVSLSYTANSSVSQPLKALSTLSGLVLSGVSNASSINMPNGWVYSGSFYGAIKYIQSILESNSRGLYIDNNEIVLYNVGVASRYKNVNLTYNTGLLKVDDITKAGETKKRVYIESIIIPQLRTERNDGAYIVEKLSIGGDNFGGKWEMQAEATA